MNLYKDENTGSYYGYDFGIDGWKLIQYPMNIDGSMDNTPIVVDFEDLVGETVSINGQEIDLTSYLLGIEEKLKREVKND